MDRKMTDWHLRQVDRYCLLSIGLAGRQTNCGGVHNRESLVVCNVVGWLVVCNGWLVVCNGWLVVCNGWLVGWLVGWLFCGWLIG